MSKPEDEGEKRTIGAIGTILYRYWVFIATALGLYAAMWLKINAPSRAQFEVLTIQVQGLREEMIRFSNQKDRVDKMEVRIEKYDERLLDLERRLSPRPPRPPL
jgi:hypothetical protein